MVDCSATLGSPWLLLVSEGWITAWAVGVSLVNFLSTCLTNVSSSFRLLSDLKSRCPNSAALQFASAFMSLTPISNLWVMSKSI